MRVCLCVRVDPVNSRAKHTEKKQNVFIVPFQCTQMQLSPSLSLSVAPRQNIYNIFWCTVQRFLIKSLPYLIYLFYQVLNLFHHLSIHFFHSLIFEKIHK